MHRVEAHGQVIAEEKVSDFLISHCDEVRYDLPFCLFRNRKRKSSISSLTNGVTDLEGAQTEVGIGSASGSLLIYSLKTSNVILKEEKLHSDAINDLVS